MLKSKRNLASDDKTLHEGLLGLNSMMKISPGRRNNFRYLLRFCFLVAGVCCGPIFVGQVIGYSSPASLHMQKLKVLSSAEISWFASLMNVGGMIGSLFVGGLLDRIGRKWTLISTAGPVLFGWLFIGWASNHGSGMKLFLFFLGRVLTGVSAGMCMTATSVYLIEIAPTAWRGAVGSCNQLGITFGIFLVYFTGMVFKNYIRLAYFGSLFPFLLVAAMMCAPESPRWLVKCGRRVEAGNALARLREPYYDVEEELRDIEESLIQEKTTASHSHRTWRSFLKPELIVPFKIALGLMIFQQLSGINAVMFYTSPIFESAGYHAAGAYVPPIIIGIVQVLATLVSVRLMDRHGRRQLLSVASFFMCTSLICLCVYYSVGSTRGWMALSCLVVYIVGFSIGWGPIPMLIAAEVFPMWARSVAGGASIFTMWVVSFVVTQSFPALRYALGPGTCFGLFAGFSFVGVLFVRRFLPETKGKSLEEIQLFFVSRAAKSVAASVRML